MGLVDDAFDSVPLNALALFGVGLGPLRLQQFVQVGVAYLGPVGGTLAVVGAEQRRVDVSLQQAKALEAGGNVKGAVRLYLRAVKEGDFNAAKALGDIYAEGKGDVGKDYADSLRYYQLAEKNGVEVPRARAR